MYAQLEKLKENKNQSAANAVAQKSTFQFVDNRPEAIVQRKMQEMTNNSPRAKQDSQLQAMADNHYDQQRKPIQKKENNTGLLDNLKSGRENLSGYSMDDIHYNSDKPTQLQTHAYAQGIEIHLDSGQEKHLPHEAWHVAQQKKGRGKPTSQLKGNTSINDDSALEKEADVMGAEAMQMDPESTQNNTSVFTHSKMVQCKPHKPQVNSKVMYNQGGAAGPAAGERCTVLASADDGSLTIRRDRDNYTYSAKNWKNDPIWLEYAADAKDTDMRQPDAQWTSLTKQQKTAIYFQAKTQAVTHIKASASPGMLNTANRGGLNNNLTLGFFSKIKKGEWQATWEEPNSNGRKWQFTIDMDDPLETSWQAAHVGWEVKLLNRGANNAVPPVAYAAFAKQQGHVWLNDVPEAR